MNSMRGYAIGIAALVILSGSRIVIGASYSIDLYNSTEYPIELVNARTGRSLTTISPGRSLGIAYAQGVDIRTADGRRLHYDRVDPPKEFIRAGRFAATLKTQLSSDLRIWLVAPTAQRPVFPPPQQPAGFPLSAR